MDVITLSGVIAVVAGAYVVTHLFLRTRGRSRREIRQDILKQVFHLREKQRDVTLESLAGALHIPQDRIAAVVAELGTDGLIETRGDTLRLTETGTTSALKLIRSHRLWERYLADETGIGESQWHKEAERQEHRLTSEETEALSRRLGHPMYDPHGDPIPRKDLELPRQRGLSLASAAIGEEYVVIHLEDEPAAVYNELDCDGRAFRLPLLTMANVTVVPARERKAVTPTGRTLNDLATGQQAKVVSLSPACRGMQRRRLLDLGILPGTHVTAELVSPLGDPVGYRVRGSLVALRKSEASLVHVEAEKV